MAGMVPDSWVGLVVNGAPVSDDNPIPMSEAPLVATVGELGSVEKADADFTTTSIAAPGDDIDGMELTFTVEDRPVYVFFGGVDMAHTVANIQSNVSLYEGATRRGLLRGQHTTAGGRIDLRGGVARFATAGEHTVRLTAHSASAGTLTVYAAAGAPIYLRAVAV